MKNIQHFILYFCSIIQSFAIDQNENSTILEEINRDTFINKTLLNSLDRSNLIQIASTTSEPTQECFTLSGGCPGCPNQKTERGTVFYNSKQLTEMSFKLFVIFLIFI